MKSDLVIANGELGLVDHKPPYDGNGVWVKRLSNGFSSCFAPENVHYVDLPIVDGNQRPTAEDMTGRVTEDTVFLRGGA
jgi:hypothetical protein